jgi:hypothetical protein
MSIWKLIKVLNFQQISSLLGKSLRHPLYMLSTVSATVKTYRISQKEFPNIHGKHNKANAFRHALWNALIAKKCARFSKNMESILRWTKSITDWHEEFAPNQALAKAMDLHNNRVGRTVYQQHSELKVEEIANFLKELLNKSIRVQDMKEMQYYASQLVYLED